MSTPLEPLPPNSFADFARAEFPAGAQALDPDQPPWGVGAAAFTWLASIALMLASALVAVVIYYLMNGLPGEGDVAAAQNDPRLVVLSLALMIPAHAATLVVCWAVVTGFGKRPFWRTVGWGWSPRMGLWLSVGIAALMYVFGIVIISLLGRHVQTPLDDMIESSSQARFLTAFLAVAGAPLVEELVYRGVLYPALRRVIGVLGAVPLVAGLFAVVHYEQYYNDPATLAAVGGLGLVLTTVRASTGRLLPCFVIHLVFNGIQCVLLVLDYFKLLPGASPQAESAFAAPAALLLSSLQIF